MATPNYLVERGVYGHLNGLHADSVTVAEAAYRANILSDDRPNQIVNPMFPRTRVRWNIVNAYRVIISSICRTDGHGRRVDYLKTATLANNASMPSFVGTIGAVYNASTGHQLQSRDVNIVQRLHDGDTARILLGGNTTTITEDAFAIDGSRFYSSISGNATVQYYGFPSDFPNNFNDLDDYFDLPNPIDAPVPDEFVMIAEYLAAGTAASAIGTFPNESSSFLSMAQQLLLAQGIDVQPEDIAPSVSPNK